jgi:iron complex transport system substrate-binding protein
MVQRIASLLASGTEIVYGLGLGDRLVAVSHECDFPAEARLKPVVTRTLVNADATSRAIDEQVRQFSSQSLALYSIDRDKLAELRPDLIITQAQCDVCAVRYADVVAAVAELEPLKHTRVVALNPVRLADVWDDVRRVAEAAGCPQAGEPFRATLRDRVDRVARVTESLAADDRPRTVCIEWADPLMAAGNWMPEIVELAGGQNGLTSPGLHSTVTAWEDVVRYDPELLLVMPCGFDLARSAAEIELLRQRPGWESLSAVRSGRVAALDGNAYFNRSGPRLVDSLEILAHLLHPGKFVPPHLAQVPIQPWRWHHEARR